MRECYNYNYFADGLFTYHSHHDAVFVSIEV